MQFPGLCITTLVSFGTLFLVAKMIGRKQIAQLDFFDYITGITIGSIAAEFATELEEPWKPFVAMVLYGGVTFLFTELIMDGRVLEENLERMGLDRTWLKKQLDQRHIHSPREVFLAVCDRDLKFVLYEKSHADK